MRAALCVVLAVLASGASSVVGQVAPSIRQGNRVRLTAPSLGLSGAVGTVQEATDEALVLQFENPVSLSGTRSGSERLLPVTVDLSEIVEMDLSVGRERKVLKATGIGLLLGAGTGALIGLTEYECDMDDPAGDPGCELGRVFPVALRGGRFGLLGGLVGLTVGLIQTHDIWFRILPGDVDLTVLPLVDGSGAGVYVGVALRFD